MADGQVEGIGKVPATPAKKISPEAMEIIRICDVDFSGGPLSKSEQAALRARIGEIQALLVQNEQGETGLDNLDIKHTSVEAQLFLSKISKNLNGANKKQFNNIPTVNNIIEWWKNIAAQADPNFDFSKIEGLVRKYAGEDGMFSQDEISAMNEDETIKTFFNTFMGMVGCGSVNDNYGPTTNDNYGRIDNAKKKKP